ncbi:MAG: hypothetical protein WC827_01370 [Candidatus Paceibacterota bacterium]|jgi:hypothetical protein
MPNIVMVGIDDEQFRGRIRQILLSMDDEGVSTDSRITKNVGSSCNEIVNDEKTHYLIVRDTNKTRGARIAVILSGKLKIYVEMEVLAGSYPCVK